MHEISAQLQLGAQALQIAPGAVPVRREQPPRALLGIRDQLLQTSVGQWNFDVDLAEPLPEPTLAETEAWKATMQRGIDDSHYRLPGFVVVS